MSESLALIACDIDGCLLPADYGVGDWNALQQVRAHCDRAARGEAPPIVFLSGRGAPYIEALAQLLGAHHGWPHLCEMGAAWFEPQTRRLTPSPLLERIDEQTLHHLQSALSPLAQQHGCLWAPKRFIRTLATPPGCDPQALAEQIRRQLEGSELGELFRPCPSARAVDILPAELDKGRALEHLLASRGLVCAEAAAVGDSVADLPMLRVAGQSGCPADAAEEVLNSVDLVASAPGAAGVAELLALWSPA